MPRDVLARSYSSSKKSTLRVSLSDMSAKTKSLPTDKLSMSSGSAVLSKEPSKWP